MGLFIPISLSTSRFHLFNLLPSQISVPASRSYIYSRSNPLLLCNKCNFFIGATWHSKILLERVIETRCGAGKWWAPISVGITHCNTKWPWMMILLPRWWTHMSIECMHWPYFPRRLLSIMHVHCTFKEMREQCIARGIWTHSAER